MKPFLFLNYFDIDPRRIAPIGFDAHSGIPTQQPPDPEIRGVVPVLRIPPIVVDALACFNLFPPFEI